MDSALASPLASDVFDSNRLRFYAHKRARAAVACRFAHSCPFTQARRGDRAGPAPAGSSRPVLGHRTRIGLPAIVDALSPERRDRVRKCLLAEPRSRGITWLRTGVVAGTAARPG